MGHDHLDNLALRYHKFGDPRAVLTMDSSQTGRCAPDMLRVAMRYAPINPSDLIPITGAYRHLILPPMTAGYEGFGTVVSAPATLAEMIGRRVLPLRGSGTWQRYVDCDPHLAVPVPDDIPDTLAARAYINPVSAYHMLRLCPVAGKHVIITGAGSFIAALLAQWAQARGATRVTGIYRTAVRRDWLASLGVDPLAENDMAAIKATAKNADIAFDAVGGPVGAAVLGNMPLGAEFVSYGLLSGQPLFPPAGTVAAYRRFHLRDVLRDQSTAEWQAGFRQIWPQLRIAQLPGTEVFPLAQWHDALDMFETPGRAFKPLLDLGDTPT
ncbi:zinc-dependent alcohol dehydrogenase family protein [Loktanella agnita]|uniref:zinc-dependent alcohol dehydrogenase family protein n=1 Tax=Loktanella agnita TaxID=287097 RepID=UPI00398A1AF8